MGREIERKYLVRGDGWRTQANAGTAYRQGYIIGAAHASVRVRMEGKKAKLNIKSATLGVSRHEFEYEIPVAEAQEMLDELCEKPLIEKTRYHVEELGHLWEVDVFEGDNAGLVVAEVELDAEEQQVNLPDWAGDEVSHDKRYYNTSLVKHPYKDW